MTERKPNDWGPGVGGVSQQGERAGSPLVRILTVDRNPLLRSGIAAIVNAEPDMVVVAEAATGSDALVKFRQHRPDVALIDLRLSDMDGVDTMQQIREFDSKARVIILSTFLGDVQAARALSSGAVACLAKDRLRFRLVDLIRST